MTWDLGFGLDFDLDRGRDCKLVGQLELGICRDDDMLGERMEVTCV